MTTSTPLGALPVLLAVLDCGSIQGASARLGLSRPTVRKRLAALEAAVGVPLVIRTATRIQPTASGVLYAERAREMVHELDVLARAARAASTTPTGVLRIGLPVGTPPMLLADLIAAMQGSWPGLRFELVTSRLPREGWFEQVDCLFCLDVAAPTGPFVTVDLGTLCEQLVASPDYLDAHPPIVSIRDLAGHPILGWIAPDTGIPDRLPTIADDAPQVSFLACTDDPTALIWMAGAGKGIALVPFAPELAVPPLVDVGPLVPVLPDIVQRQRRRRLLIVRPFADLPAIRSFLDATAAASASF